MSITRKKCNKIRCKMASSRKADFAKQHESVVNIDVTPVAQLDRASDF